MKSLMQTKPHLSLSEMFDRMGVGTNTFHSPAPLAEGIVATRLSPTAERLFSVTGPEITFCNENTAVDAMEHLKDIGARGVKLKGKVMRCADYNEALNAAEYLDGYFQNTNT